MKKFFHKIHLWLSIPLGIIVAVICFSGAMLVFQTEINEISDSDKYFVKEVQGEPMPLDKLVETVNAKLDDNTVTSVEVPSDAKRNYVMGLENGNRAFIYVNPYTGEITGKTERGSGFFSIMMRLHRWLLDDSRQIGKPIVGYTTLFMVFILISGILIWLPKTKKQLKGRLQIKTKYGKKRFFADLHTSAGIYLAIGLLVLALTGLNFSFDWYRSGFYKLFGAQTTAMNNERGGNPNYKSEGGNPNYKGEGNPNYKGGGGNPNYQKKDEADGVTEKSAPTERGENPNYKGGGGNPNYKGGGGNPNYPKKEEVEKSINQKTEIKENKENKGVKETVDDNKTAEEQPERSGGNPNYRGGGGNPNYQGRRGGNPNYQKEKSADTTGIAEHTVENKVQRANRDSVEVKLQASEHPATATNVAQKDQKDSKKTSSKYTANAAKDEKKDEMSAPKDSISLVPIEPYFAQWANVLDSVKLLNPDFKTMTVQKGSVTVAPNTIWGNVRATDRYQFDNSNGKITGVKLYKDQDRTTKLRGWIYTIHVGAWGGMFSKTLTFLVAILGASLPLTGYYIYFIKRKKKKRKVS